MFSFASVPFASVRLVAAPYNPKGNCLAEAGVKSVKTILPKVIIQAPTHKLCSTSGEMFLAPMAIAQPSSFLVADSIPAYESYPLRYAPLIFNRLLFLKTQPTIVQSSITIGQSFLFPFFVLANQCLYKTRRLPHGIVVESLTRFARISFPTLSRWITCFLPVHVIFRPVILDDCSPEIEVLAPISPALPRRSQRLQLRASSSANHTWIFPATPLSHLLLLSLHHGICTLYHRAHQGA